MFYKCILWKIHIAILDNKRISLNTKGYVFLYFFRIINILN